MLRIPKGRAPWLTARYWFLNNLMGDPAALWKQVDISGVGVPARRATRPR
jgi:hypothetical protein